MKKCPYCAEKIQDEAIVCRYCGRELPQPVSTHVSNNGNPSTSKNAQYLRMWLIFTTILATVLIYLWVMNSANLIAAYTEEFHVYYTHEAVRSDDNYVWYNFDFNQVCNDADDACYTLLDISKERTTAWIFIIIEFALIIIGPIAGWFSYKRDKRLSLILTLIPLVLLCLLGPLSAVLILLFPKLLLH